MKTILIFVVRAYQAALGPLLGGACKFHPSCSQYAVEAIERHGVRHGGWLAVRRLWRCRPFVEGGYDPVPEECAPMQKAQPFASQCTAQGKQAALNWAAASLDFARDKRRRIPGGRAR